MTPEARADIYPQIMETAIATRGIPDFYQFQFNETLCPNPRSGRGNILRHYELIHLSRRPKPEALVLADLIRKYSAENDPVRTLPVFHAATRLDEQGHGEATLVLTNAGKSSLKLAVGVESGEELFSEMAGKSKIVLRPGERQAVAIKMSAVRPQPGFYHAFLRVQGDNGFLRYGWIEARLSGKSVFAGDSPNLDWNKPVFIAYGQEAPALEVETAIAIAETLESASGQTVEAVQASDLPDGHEQTANLILVGTSASNKLIQQAAFRSPAPPNPGAIGPFTITGRDSRVVEEAGMNFILTYWKNAKDSAAARVGLLAKELPRGGDATKLP